MSTFKADDNSNSIKQNHNDKETERLIANAQNREDLHLASIARDELLEKYNPLIMKIAHKYTTNQFDLDDLVQAGRDGLLRAIEYFNPEKGISYLTYAYPIISQFMMEYLANTSLIKVPYYFRKKNAGAEYQLDVPRACLWLDKPVGDTKQISLDFVEGEGNPEIIYFIQNKREVVRKALNTLLPNEKKTIEYHYGFHGNKEFTLEEIGTMLHLSRQRIHQIKVSGLQKIKLYLVKNNLVQLI